MEEKTFPVVGTIAPFPFKLGRKQTTIDDLFESNFGLQKGNLWVQVLEGRNVSKKNGIYCEFAVEGRPKRTTMVNGTKTLYWGEELNFDVEDEQKTNIVIRICTKKTLGMRKVLGELKFPILDQFLEANSEHVYEGWFVIPAVKSKKTSSAGFLQLRMRYVSKHERNVFYRLASSYRPQIMELFKENDEMLLDLCKFQNNEKLSKTLVRLLSGISAEKVINFLVKIVTQEAKLGEKETVLRGDSMGVRCLISYIKMEMTQYLSKTIGELMEDLLKTSTSIELDPSKEKPTTLAQNQTKMEEITSKFFKAISQSATNIPDTISSLFYRLEVELKGIFQDEIYTAQVLTRFLFLRILCSSIVNPKTYKLWGEEIEEIRVARTLATISKFLQLAANEEVEFKEDHLQIFNKLLRDNVQPIKSFFRAIIDKGKQVHDSSTKIETKNLTQEQEKKCICILLTLYEEVADLVQNQVKKEQRMSQELQALHKIVSEKDFISIPELKVTAKPRKDGRLTRAVILTTLPTDFSYIPRDSSVELASLTPNGKEPKMKFTSSYKSFQNMFPITPSPSEGSLATKAETSSGDSSPESNVNLFRSKSTQ